MKVDRWLIGLNIFLVVALLSLAGFTGQLYSRQSQLSQRATALEGALSQRSAELLAQMTQVKEGLSQDLATTAGELESADVALSQSLLAQGDQFSSDIASAQARLQDLQGQLRTAQGQREAAEATLKEAIASQGASFSQQIQAATAGFQGLQDRVVDFTQLYTQVRDSIVEVRVSRPTGQGISAGFLYGAGGRFIVTAHHSIEGATQINVIPSAGGSGIPATLVGGDPMRDVALLRLARPLSASPLVLADSAQVKVGQPVMVVGSPFGETASASTGIVSGVNRQETWDGKSGDDMLQFDAAANPGNSGGPLLNAQGEVIGLVVSRIDPAEGAGVNYAVAANTVKAIVDPLLR